MLFERTIVTALAQLLAAPAFQNHLAECWIHADRAPQPFTTIGALWWLRSLAAKASKPGRQKPALGYPATPPAHRSIAVESPGVHREPPGPAATIAHTNRPASRSAAKGLPAKSFPASAAGGSALPVISLFGRFRTNSGRSGARLPCNVTARITRMIRSNVQTRRGRRLTRRTCCRFDRGRKATRQSYNC